MNTPRKSTRQLKPIKAIHTNSSFIRSRSSIKPIKVQSRIDFFEKRGDSTNLPYFPGTSALPPIPDQDRKRSYNDSFDGVEESEIQPAKQLCFRESDLSCSRQRTPATNPHCRGRLADKICSVPQLPAFDFSLYQSQMSLANMFPVKKTVETQTSPLELNKKNDLVLRSSSLKESTRYKRNSRSLLNSAHRTDTNLKRSVAGNLTPFKAHASENPMNLKSKSQSKLPQAFSKSSSKLRRMGKSLKNLLTKRIVPFTSQASISKSQSKLNSFLSDDTCDQTDIGSENNNGLQYVTIRRPQSKKFGFFIAKKNNGDVYVSQISPNSDHLKGLIKPGDMIHTMDGLSCKYLSLSEIYESFRGKHDLVLQISSDESFY